MRLETLRDKRVAVWGAGREARAALRVLHARLPGQPLTVIAPAAEAEAAQALCRPGDTLLHAEALTLDELLRQDVVIKSPGVSPYQPLVEESAARGVHWTSGTALWFAAHPDAHVIAVTGTKGKSTTAALLAHLLRGVGRRVCLCGNIGMPLLEALEPQPVPDWWVMELSSFQVRDMHAVPEVAVVLNLFPEHLDWHGTPANYYRDKLRLLEWDGRHPRVTVLNAQQQYPIDPVPGTVFFGAPQGFHVRDQALWEGAQRLLGIRDLPLPGAHNAHNLCAALTALKAIGVEAREALAALPRFRPLPHRLQPLGVRDGVEYVNDSIATTPHATLAALAHYSGRPVTVLIGGFDRGVSWEAFAQAVRSHPPHALVLFAQGADRIAQALAQVPATRYQVRNLPEAVRMATQVTPAGGVVLLSPGAPSFGEFRDYVERGRRFAELAGFDPDSITHIEGLGIWP